MSVSSSYEAGDAVDALVDSCWWEGHVTAVWGENVKVSFKSPPEGEGGVLTVNFKDLRPTLVWSDGKWTLPASESSSKRQIGLFEDARGHIILDEDSEKLDQLQAEDDRLESEDQPEKDSASAAVNPFPSLTDEDIRQGFETLLGHVPRATHPGVQQLGLRGFFKQKVIEMNARELFPGSAGCDHQVLEAQHAEKIGEDTECLGERKVSADEQESGARSQPQRTKAKTATHPEPQNRDGKYADPKKVTVTSAQKADRIIRNLLERWEDASLAEIATAFESINGFTLSGPEEETEAKSKSRYEKQFLRMQETGQQVKWTYRTDTRRGRTVSRWVLRLRPWPEARAGKARERDRGGARKGGAHVAGLEPRAAAGEVRERHSAGVQGEGAHVAGLEARDAASKVAERQSAIEVPKGGARAVGPAARGTAGNVRAERGSGEEVRNGSARGAGLSAAHTASGHVSSERDNGSVRSGGARGPGQPRVTSKAEAMRVIRPLLERWESVSTAEAARAFLALAGWRPRWRADGAVRLKAWYEERIRKMKRLGKRYVRIKAKKKDEKNRRGAFDYRFRLWPDDWARLQATFGAKKPKASESAHAAARNEAPSPAMVIAKRKRTRFGEAPEAVNARATAVKRTEGNARLDEAGEFARQKRRFSVTEEDGLCDRAMFGSVELRVLKGFREREPERKACSNGLPVDGNLQSVREANRDRPVESAGMSKEGAAKRRPEETGARREVCQENTANLDSDGLNEDDFLHFCFQVRGRGEGACGRSDGPVTPEHQSAWLRELGREVSGNENGTRAEFRSPVLVPTLGGSKGLQPNGSKVVPGLHSEDSPDIWGGVERQRPAAGGTRVLKTSKGFAQRRGEPSAGAQAEARVHGAEAAMERMRTALRGMTKASTAYVRQVFRCVTGWVPAEESLEESGWRVKDWYKTSFEEMLAAEEVMVRERDASVPGGFRFRLEAWPEESAADERAGADRNRNGGEKRKRSQENDEAMKAGRSEGLHGTEALIGSTGHAADHVEEAARELKSIDSNRLEGARVLAELRVQKRKSAEYVDGDLRLNRIRRTMAEQTGGSPQVRAANPLVCLSD
ncbi:hypothetical protein KFL_002460130 [Klebsormidium nitens]|uniref:Agenet domain-containing protein n=1 Tax=Klebsormidium nitens TaxID=105231 RepID=A0A1Y1IA95_KLENI|nr:hypothetical protein KFL_002460130 [Klebsormidium nitens]|eukprot:GAQ85637.1 hypothetical protein KFL_002460130 [Klebsormidium nitens]